MDDHGLDDLLQRARRQDPAALSKLVELYSPRVFGLLYRLTGTRDAAEDLLQETFLRVVRMIGQYEHLGKFESWLFRIAANVARDRARRLGRRPEVDLPAGAPDDRDMPIVADPGADSENPHDRVVRSEDRQRLADELQRLPEIHREIILLRHYADMSFQEIADLLGIPLGTALARAHRALRRLRSELTDED